MIHRPVSSVLFSVTVFAVALPAQAPNWTQRNPASQPAARQNSAMAHDLIRGVTVLFGGWNGTQRVNDTWEWDGANWNQVLTANAPSPRDGMVLAYDVLRQVTVCTAGYIGSTETWEYDGVDWTQVLSATTHQLGPHNPMVYDLNRGVCVLFGFSSASSSYETWEWDGVDWTQVVTAVRPGFSGSMAYDEVRGKTVHFGDSGDTWEYDGVAWTQVFTAMSPPGRGCGSELLVYDLVNQAVVLFGGCPSTGAGDTWQYDGVDWQQVVTQNAPSFPRRHLAMAYDLTHQRVVLFGGRDLSTGTAQLVDDTWELGPFVCPPASTSNLGFGNGPTISTTATGVFGTMIDATIAGANPNGSGSMLLGVSAVAVPLNVLFPACGGSLAVSSPIATLPAPTDAQGEFTLGFPGPTTLDLCGATLYLQYAELVIGPPCPIVVSDTLGITFGS